MKPTPETPYKAFLIGAGSLMLILVVLGAALLWHRHHQPAVATAPHQAVIQATTNGFIPATVSIKLGTEVVWKSTDAAAHVVASDPYPADSSVLGLHSRSIVSGGSYTYTPTAAGTISYHDDNNPSHNGTVVVTK